MARQKRHHYLSEAYLAGFCGQRGRLWIYDRERRQYRSQIPREVAFQNYFYSFGDSAGQRNEAIEKLLAQVESDGLPCIRRLRAGQSLSPPERMKVALFIAFLRTRVPEFHEFLQEAHQKMAQSILRRVEAMRARRGADNSSPVYYEMGENAVEVPIETVRESATKPLPREVSLKAMLMLSQGLANAIAAANWLVLKAPEDTSFVTSDDPVVPLWPKRIGIYGTPLLSVTKVIPVAADTVLLVGGDGSGQVNRRMGKAETRKFNLGIAESSTAFVIARDEALLKSLISKAKLQTRPQRQRVTVS